MIYRPREDSYLLLKALPEELDGEKALDVGTGSGVVAEEMMERGAEVTAVDRNPEAVRGKAYAHRSDLFENVESKFDLITFNPPYLPSSDDIEGAEAWNGGESGNELVERFAEEAPRYLRPGGEAFVVASSRGGLELDWEVVESLRLFFEELYVLKVTKDF